MRIGMPTLVELKTIEENIALCLKLNLDFIELNMNLPQFSTNMDMVHIKSLLDEAGIGVTLHAAERIDILELDPIIREGYLQALKKTNEIGKYLGAELINVHLSEGIHFKLPHEKVYLNNEFKPLYMSLVDAFKDLVKDFDVPVHFENTGMHHHEFLSAATDVLLESDCINLTYDIGHDVTSGYNDRAYFKKQHHKIRHYHIHDGHSEKNHMTLYSGSLDIDAFMEEVKEKNCSCVIEVKSVEHLTQSVYHLREKGYL